jgi:Cof subfamily protein (haloacid dehalogenase superfamily)
MARVDLVVTDLDGTLWSGHEVTHPGTVGAWRELEQRDIRVVVATGRRVASAREPLARLGLAPTAVVLNGAIVLDLATDERFHHQAFAPDDARAVLAAFRAAGLEPSVYVDHPTVDVFLDENPSTHPAHVATLTTSERAALDEVVGELPVLMFGIMGHPVDPLEVVASALRDVAEAHLAPDQWGDHSFTVTPRGLSKWVGVEVCCARLDADPSRVLAIGDGPNDVELLRAASVAVVPDGAHPAALAVADHVVPCPSDGGWARILDLV